MVLSTGRVVRALGARDRVARIAALFTFIGHLGYADASPELRDGVDVLARLAGAETAQAVLLAAMLKAAGERAQVDYAREMVFVRVEIERADVARLPPHAALIVARRRGRCYLPLWIAHARSPLGFLPRTTREGLARRRFIA